jgi:hypothetical protein
VSSVYNYKQKKQPKHVYIPFILSIASKDFSRTYKCFIICLRPALGFNSYSLPYYSYFNEKLKILNILVKITYVQLSQGVKS